MTKTEIIAQANARTEGKAEKLNLFREYVNALQEVCGEHRFYWRLKKATFNTTAGTQAYLLSGNGITDFGQIRGVYLKFQGQMGKLVPVTDRNKLMDCLNDTTQGDPVAYTLGLDSFDSLKLFPIPNDVYELTVEYYAMPNPGDEAEDVPLVPPVYHQLVAQCLEMNLLAFLYGPDDKAFAYSSARYQKLLADAIKQSRDFEVGIYREMRPVESAIRGTY